MGEIVERLGTVILVIAAAAIAAVVVRREFFPDRDLSPGPGQMTMELVDMEAWQDVFNVGIIQGNRDAPFQLVEFTDLECPACRRFELEVLEPLREGYGKDLAVTFVHFPLPRNRFARPAAAAAECAGGQDRFQDYILAVYEGQDSLGLKTWTQYAIESAVPDTSAFNDCLKRQPPPPRIDGGYELGRRIGVQGTPTILLNGRRFSRPPSRDELAATIDSLRVEGQSHGTGTNLRK